MDSLEVNKGVAAVLAAGIAFMGVTLISQALVKPAHLEKTAIAIEGAAPVVAAAAAEDPPVALLLASADASRGQADTQKQGCVACHSFNEGGKAGVGPNLYGVVNAPHGHMEGYAYSAVLKGKSGPWTYDELNAWLKKPSTYAPGTKMSYAGWSDAKGRADIIDYLRTLSHDPAPLPAAPAQQASAPVPTPSEAASPVKAPTAPAAPSTTAAGDEPPIAALLASADVAAGQKQTMTSGCVACHSFNEGGKTGVGPNLYGVVGAPHGHMEGYTYSAALKGKEGPWTYDELSAWLKKPSTYAPGTKMSFAGLASQQARANVIAYLRSLSPNPEPLPPVAD
jgi:cytochrome c